MILTKKQNSNIDSFFKFYQENSKKRRHKLLWHFIFWCFFLELYFLSIGQFFRDLDKSYYLLYTLLYLTNILFYYASVSRQSKIGYRNLFGILILLLCWFSCYLIVFKFIVFLIPDASYISRIQEQFSLSSTLRYKTIFAQAIDSNAGVTLFPISFLAFYRFWEKQQISKKLLEEELRLNLNLLKTQINPNLLFNTLDKLKEIVSDQPDVEESIQKLSSLMAYSINETGNDAVDLKREIEFIEEYVSLARMRLNEKKKINLEIIGNPVHLKIRPLILISFVENSIKHGLNKTNKNAWVDIKIVIEKSELLFNCSNSLSSENKSTDFETSGIGLKNTKKRLSYYYPKKHELKISEFEKEYSVNLRIQLD